MNDVVRSYRLSSSEMTEFRIRGELGEEIVDIEFIHMNGERDTFLANKKLSKSWETIQIPYATNQFIINLKNDHVYPDGTDRNVHIDVNTIKDTKYGRYMKPYIVHTIDTTQQHVVNERDRAHEVGVFAWGGKYNVYLTPIPKLTVVGGWDLWMQHKGNTSGYNFADKAAKL